MVLPQVGHQLGQLLREEVLEHPLVHLEAGERTVSAAPSHPGSPHAILELLSVGPPCPGGTEHPEGLGQPGCGEAPAPRDFAAPGLDHQALTQWSRWTVQVLASGVSAPWSP